MLSYDRGAEMGPVTVRPVGSVMSLAPEKPVKAVTSLEPVGSVAPPHHFGSLRFSLGLDDLLPLVLLCLLHIELGSLRLLLGCRGTSQLARKVNRG